ncbi:hypothetical protein Lfu02_43980 [Longispora fulva]|uniref:Uncharacterized protein n=1 Tax=Longispora fulva TaxID=619741 RepID=A0A8J7GFE6_9ACTN|nr:hypothetical protein [Longispora fulva]MBG6136855.1 hypothetical protein [Longispora fulva]GIG60026.1 hypothetical protein Lfu02_43980 [Longispora fulva]
MQLPDRWFGRPFDNAHELTWAEQRPGRLLLELDNRQYLIFVGDVLVVDGPELCIGGFEELVFVWQGYGDSARHVETHDVGEVRFHPSR